MVLKSKMLDNLTKGLDKKIDAALTKTAIAIEGDAKSLCPVDKGILRASISHEVTDNTATVGTNVEYAPHVELGTYKMAAKPYLYPAYAKNKGKITKLLAAELRRL